MYTNAPTHFELKAVTFPESNRMNRSTSSNSYAAVALSGAWAEVFVFPTAEAVIGDYLVVGLAGC